MKINYSMANLEKFLVEDRQWLRPQRIAHAKQQMRFWRAQSNGSDLPIQFWREVLKRLGSENQ